jgi:hypothetical protein
MSPLSFELDDAMAIELLLIHPAYVQIADLPLGHGRQIGFGQSLYKEGTY